MNAAIPKLYWQFTDNGHYLLMLSRVTSNETLSKFHFVNAGSHHSTDGDLNDVTYSLQYAIPVIYRDQCGRTKIRKREGNITSK